jgi:hypothetical protein
MQPDEKYLFYVVTQSAVGRDPGVGKSTLAGAYRAPVFDICVKLTDTRHDKNL